MAPSRSKRVIRTARQCLNNRGQGSKETGDPQDVALHKVLLDANQNQRDRPENTGEVDYLSGPIKINLMARSAASAIKLAASATDFSKLIGPGAMLNTASIPLR